MFGICGLRFESGHNELSGLFRPLWGDPMAWRNGATYFALGRIGHLRLRLVKSQVPNPKQIPNAKSEIPNTLAPLVQFRQKLGLPTPNASRIRWGGLCSVGRWSIGRLALFEVWNFGFRICLGFGTCDLNLATMHSSVSFGRYRHGPARRARGRTVAGLSCEARRAKKGRSFPGLRHRTGTEIREWMNHRDRLVVLCFHAFNPDLCEEVASPGPICHASAMKRPFRTGCSWRVSVPPGRRFPVSPLPSSIEMKIDLSCVFDFPIDPDEKTSVIKEGRPAFAAP